MFLLPATGSLRKAVKTTANKTERQQLRSMEKHTTIVKLRPPKIATPRRDRYILETSRDVRDRDVGVPIG